jgi:hypothetical protein
MTRRGGVLFEIVLSVAIFVGAATFVLAASRNVVDALDRAQREQEAMDIARSKLAEIEAGLTVVADLRDGRLDRVGSIELEPLRLRRDDTTTPPWTIDVQTGRTDYADLTLVEITVAEDVPGLPGMIEPGAPTPISVTLRQLIRLREDDPELFETDDLLEGLPEEAGP